MALIIILAVFLTLLQNGLTQFTENRFVVQLPGYTRDSSPVYIPENAVTHWKSAPDTTVTDCTPSVRRNLGHLLQLMIIGDLLQTTSIETTAALTLAMPIIREVLSSPSIARICPHSLIRKFNKLSSLIPQIGQNLAPDIPVPNIFIPNDPLQATVPNLNYLPPNLNYQNIPLPINRVPNNIATNRNIVPLDSLENRAILNSLPPNIFYQNYPPHGEHGEQHMVNIVPSSTVLQNKLPAFNLIRDVQANPGNMPFKSAFGGLESTVRKFLTRSGPVTDNLNRISSNSLPLMTVSAPLTKPVIKILMRS